MKSASFGRLGFSCLTTLFHCLGYRVLLRESGTDEGRGDATAVASGVREQIAHKVNAATLPGSTKHSADRGFQSFMGIGDHQLHATQTAAGQLA